MKMGPGPVDGPGPTPFGLLGDPDDVSIRHAVAAVITVLTVCMAFGLLYRFHFAVFLLFVAIAFQVALDPIVSWLSRRGLTKIGAVLLVYAVLLTLVAGIAWLSAPVLAEQTRALLQSVPESYLQLRTKLLDSPVIVMRVLGAALPSTPSLAMLTNGVGNGPVESDAATGWRLAGSAGKGLFAIFGVMALALYWTVEGDVILRRLVMKAPPDRRSSVREFIAESQVKIGGYFRGQGILCVLVGLVTAAVLGVIGIPYALLLGLLMTILEAVPVVGSILGSVPALLVTAAAAPDKLGLVFVAMVAIQVAEANLLVPRIMNNAVGVSAIVSILALAGFGVLFGSAGALMGIPLAAILQILIFRLLFDVPIGDASPKAVVLPQDVGRTHVGVLRLEAKGLIQAIRRQARRESNTEQEGLAAAEFEDEIEALAAELDALLATADGAA